MRGKKQISFMLCLGILFSMFSGQAAKAKTVIYPTVASGQRVTEDANCVIDYSNCQDGYVMVKYKRSTNKTLKCQVIADNSTDRKYTYTLKAGQYQAIPLTEGNTSYKITVFENVSGNSYATVKSASINVTLSSQFAPYLRPNQYVNYKKNTKCVKKAASLTKKSKTDLAKVKKVYRYVVKNFKYDKKLAASVQAGYVPNLDKAYKKKKGICFDYAALMTAMLRSQGVPTKLVVGYTGNAYHAWINVYAKKKGWITGAIYFNGKKWKLMDPTFASTSKSSKSIMKYIGNGRNYKAKYSY